MEIKKFNRHECMDENMMDSIQNAIFAFRKVPGVGAFGVLNMLYGLYDGFNYADAIMDHSEMQVVKGQNRSLYDLIAYICETAKNYPAGTTKLHQS